MSDAAMNLETGMAMMQSRQQSLPKINQKANYTPAQARKVAKKFEAVYLAQMLQPMFEGLKASAPFGGGSAEKTWRSLQIQEYGKALADNGGIGIANAVMKQLLHNQESAGLAAQKKADFHKVSAAYRAH